MNAGPPATATRAGGPGGGAQADAPPMTGSWNGQPCAVPTPANCALNLAWGTGETPIKPILQLVKKNKWTMPASVELEYNIPEGSDAVKEVKKCVEYCRTALTS